MNEVSIVYESYYGLEGDYITRIDSIYYSKKKAIKRANEIKQKER